jgi:hypothetical protein
MQTSGKDSALDVITVNFMNYAVPAQKELG